jgi:nucleotide-binding universal stress UspA family protein
MANHMKIVIGYDGSECADRALDDLQRAGLPDDVEALVLSVADVWLLPQGESEAPAPLGASATMREARASAAAMLETAESNAEKAASRLKQLFPTWQIRAESAADSPAWAIILKAEEWDADLIVVGSQGHSALGRWVLGSVSYAVMTHAHCSVRIARSRNTPPGRPLRIFVGVDGSYESEMAVKTVAGRSWPKGTDIRLVLVLNPSLANGIASATATSETGAATASMAYESMDSDVDALDAMISKMLEEFASIAGDNPSGATVTTSLISGDPKRVLVEEAERWGADSIFVGSRGLNRLERLLLGSVSSAVAVRAHCPVEVVRAPRPRKEQ